LPNDGAGLIVVSSARQFVRRPLDLRFASPRTQFLAGGEPAHSCSAASRASASKWTIALAERVTRDIAQVSPETTVNRRILNLNDPWDFQEVYGAMRDFADAYSFDTEREDYRVNITTGTHVAQICLFPLVEAHYVPAKILQLTPPKRWREGGAGTYGVIDLDLMTTKSRREDRASVTLDSPLKTVFSPR
jgi:sigma54-dependent transcription regulator